MKRNINRAISFFGYKLKAIDKDPIKCSGVKNKVIELIGPSGIGKSTLLNTVGKFLQGDWNLSYPTNTRLKNKSSDNLDNFYMIVLHQKICSLNNEEENIGRFSRMLSFNLKRLQQDRYLRWSGLLDKGGWFLDDGFCHVFGSEIIEIIEDNKIENSVLNKFFENRNFILLEAHKERILENLKDRQRKKKSALNDHLSKYGKRKIDKHIQNSIDESKRFVKYVSKYNTKIYTIDLMKSGEDTIKQMKNIEKNIIYVK